MCPGSPIPNVEVMTDEDSYRGSVTADVNAGPDEVFGLIVDVARLPEWNARLPRVVAPRGPLVEGSEWVVVQHGIGPGIRWSSRAQVIELDRVARRFGYRSGSDGPNPSFAVWTWTVTPIDAGSRVRVGWQLNPRTFWRRALGARLRHRQLRSEVGASLGLIERLVTPDIGPQKSVPVRVFRHPYPCEPPHQG
jgi:hypothetical protein